MPNDNENNIGGKVSLDTTDFKANIAELNRQIKVIDSGFKAAAAGMDDWSASEQGLQERIKALNGITDAQRQKVEQLNEQYKKVATEKGENSKAAQDLQIKINKETASLNKNESELRSCKNSLENFGKESNNTREKVEKLASSLGKIGGGIAKTAAVGIAAITTAAAACAAGIFKMATASAEYADGVQKAADVTGLSAERVQELTYAGKNLGVEFDTIAGAQAKLTKSMAGAKDSTKGAGAAFAELGINVRDKVTGELRDSKVVMQEALNALNGVGNETQRDALAMSIFGKSAMELNPLIKAGGDELARLTAEAKKNGAVMSGEQIAALDAFGDSLENLKMSGKGLAANITMAVMPALQDMVSSVQNVTNAVGGAVKSGDWSQVGVAVSQGINGIVEKIADFTPKLADIAAKVLSGLAGAILQAVPKVLPSLATATMNFVTSMVKTIADNGPLLIKAGLDTIKTIVNGLIEALPLIVDAALSLVGALASGIGDNLQTLIPKAIDAVLTLVQGLVDNIPMLVEAALKLVIGLALGIVQALPKIIEKAPEIIESLITGLIDSIPLLIDAAIQLIVGLVEFLTNPDNIGLIVKCSWDIVVAIVKGLIKAIPKLADGVWELIKSIIKAFTSIDWIAIGKSIISGIINGIKDMGGALIDAVKDAASGALNGIKDFLGIKSPSRVMREQVGQMIGAGMAEGIKDSIPGVKNAMAALKNQIEIPELDPTDFDPKSRPTNRPNRPMSAYTLSIAEALKNQQEQTPGVPSESNYDGYRPDPYFERPQEENERDVLATRAVNLLETAVGLLRDIYEKDTRPILDSQVLFDNHVRVKASRGLITVNPGFTR